MLWTTLQPTGAYASGLSWRRVHGVDAEGGVVIRQKLTRARLLKFFEKLAPCLVGIEACGTAHH
jgi:transposase